MSAVVALSACADYNQKRVCDTIEKLLNLAPPPDVTGKTVLLKPNILSPKKPETAVCTHPAVVYAAVKAFLSRGAARVWVGESPGTANGKTAAKTVGIYDAVINAGGAWVDFEDGVDVPCPGGKLVKKLTFACSFSEADIVVSLAKLKTHQLMAYTGVMKNLFGLMVGLNKAQTHLRFPDKKDFSAFLTDLNIAAHAQYGIMDSITAMEGPGGPGNGNPVHIGMLAASGNILALDWTCAKLVGYEPGKIENLADAMERGVWLHSEDEIELKGDSFEELKPKHFEIVHEPRGTALLKPWMPKFIHHLASFFFILRPYFSNKKCIRCGRCITICPAQVLSFSGNADRPKEKRHIVIDTKKCLHCYCCHEICPADAITLRRSW